MFTLVNEVLMAAHPLARPNDKKSRPGGRLSSNQGGVNMDGMKIHRDGPVSRTVERENGAGMVNERLTKRRDRVSKLVVIRKTGLTPNKTGFR